jgi:hypothetical protein
MGDPRVHPSLSRSVGPSTNHLPRRPSPGRPSAGPARPAPASSARLQPQADDAPSWTWRATTPTPGHPKPYGCRPCTPRNLIPVGHRGRTDTGRRTLDTWTLRRPHRTPVTGQAPWDTGRSHRTLDTDAGHEADTVTTAQPASGPPWPPRRADRTLRRARVLCSRTTRQPLGRLASQARASAHCCPQTIRVEGRANGEASSVMTAGLGRLAEVSETGVVPGPRHSAELSGSSG